MSLIHRYKSNGFNIVLDINSGCIHLVDEVTYEVLPYLEEGLGTEAIAEKLENKYNREDIETSVRECNKLKEDGMLFTKDVYENVIEEFSNNRQTVVKALCLHIAHDCNLACRYCFAEEGEYHGRRALMSYEVGKKALDFLIANSGSRNNLEVDFFGGEPLMNWQVVKDLVKYGREQEKLHNKKFRFTLTTNGVLLNDEVMEFCNKEMSNVVLSVDGRKEVHDYMRPFRKGAGSYDLIMPKFQKFAESRNQDKYYVRGTFTHHNLDFSKDVLHLADLGFKQISVEPVVAADTEEYAIREEDIPQIMEEYDTLAKEMIKREKEGKGFNFFHFMIDLTGGNFAVPIIGQSQFLLLTGHVGDIFHRPFSRVDTMFDRGILSRHTKRIPAHRMQHVKTVHTAEAGNYVADGIIAYVSHMQVARRIREHVQHIRLGFACINISFKGLVIFPIFLPFAFYGMGSILFFDHSSHNLLKFAYHRSAANKKVPGC